MALIGLCAVIGVSPTKLLAREYPAHASGKGFLAGHPCRPSPCLTTRRRVSFFQGCFCSLTECSAFCHPVDVLAISRVPNATAPVRRELHGRQTTNSASDLEYQSVTSRRLAIGADDLDARGSLPNVPSKDPSIVRRRSRGSLPRLSDDIRAFIAENEALLKAKD
jgi:hypothetical protein